MTAKASYFLAFFLLLAISLYGQKDYEKGYIVTQKNDTIYGKIKDRKSGISPRLYKKIRFRTENSLFHKKYAPHQLLGYKAGERVYESFGLKKESSLFSTRYMLTPSYPKIFLKRIHKGKLSYYHWEHLDYESGYIDYIPLFHLNERNEMCRATQGIFGLKSKSLAKYFIDCPELSDIIRTNTLNSPEEILKLFEKLCL